MLAAIPALPRVQRFVVRSEYFKPSGNTEVRLLKIGTSVVYSSTKVSFSLFKTTHKGARPAEKLGKTQNKVKHILRLLNSMPAVPQIDRLQLKKEQ